MSLPAPNYTKTPNEIFTVMPEMSEAELRVTLAIVRKTFGWQKEKDRISYSQLEELTGLSRVSITKGLNEGVKRGFIKAQKTKGKTTVYSLNVEDEPVKKVYQSESELVKKLNQTSKVSLPVTSKVSLLTKESILNKLTKESPFTALKESYESATGFLVAGDDDTITAFEDMVKFEIQPEDIQSAVVWLRENGGRFEHPKYIIKSARKALRDRKKNQQPKEESSPWNREYIVIEDPELDAKITASMMGEA